MKAKPREVHMGGGKVRFARPFLGAAWSQLQRAACRLEPEQGWCTADRRDGFEGHLGGRGADLET